MERPKHCSEKGQGKMGTAPLIACNFEKSHIHPCIGETKWSQDHRGYITQKKDHPVGNHFNGPGHEKNPVADLKVV